MDKLSRDEIITLFNDELITFISELLKIFNQINKNIPEESFNTIITYKNLIETGIAINKEIGIEMFSVYIFSKANNEFSNKISARDYEYFYNIEEDLNGQNHLIELIMIIKNLFRELSSENQENIFGYLENLCVLSNGYFLKKIT